MPRIPRNRPIRPVSLSAPRNGRPRLSLLPVEIKGAARPAPRSGRLTGSGMNTLPDRAIKKSAKGNTFRNRADSNCYGRLTRPGSLSRVVIVRAVDHLPGAPGVALDPSNGSQFGLNGFGVGS